MPTVDLEHMSRNGAPPKAQSPKQGYLWWTREGDELAQDVQGSLEFMREKQTARLNSWVISTRLYGNQPLANRTGVSFSQILATSPWLKERMSWNIVQAVCDTVISKLIKNKPKPMFLTDGGSYKLQRRAKKTNQFLEGVFYENKVHPQIGPQAALDATVWGDGVVHVYAYNGRVRMERVICSELWVDEHDGFYGEPRNMHRVTDLDRHVLLALAEKWLEGESEKDRKATLQKIRDARPANPDDSADFLADKVTVAESWHLPSKEDGDDGVHALTIEGCTIWREKWEHSVFPFAFLKWAPRLHGFWAQGISEQLQNLQLEINTLLQTIKQSFWKGGTFRVFLPSGSRLVKEHITNQIGTVVSYSGEKPPTIVTPSLVQPEVFAHLENLWRKGFEQSGVAQMNATGAKPAGLDSGKALREFNDIQTDRFQKFGQAYEQFFLDLGHLAVMTVKDLAKGGHKSYKVKVPLQGNAMKEIDWADVNLSEDQYVMRCFPVSSLPQEPAGRMQTIVEFVQAGWLTPRQGRRLMDMPDLDMADSLATAAEDYLTEILEQMVEDDGEFIAPEPFDDLVLARELALEHYQRGKIQHVPDKKLENIRRFITALDQYEAAAKIKAQAEAGTMQAPGITTPAATQSPGGGAPGAPPDASQKGSPTGKNPPAPTADMRPNAVVAQNGGSGVSGGPAPSPRVQ